MAVASGGDRVLVEATFDSLKLHHFSEAIVSRNDLDRGFTRTRPFFACISTSRCRSS
ncbi:MAG: hypothetical protein ACRC11_14730 [Xenococcaceae cyanobacterium]